MAANYRIISFVYNERQLYTREGGYENGPKVFCGTLIEGPRGGLHYINILDSMRLFLYMSHQVLRQSGIKTELLSRIGINNIDYAELRERLAENNGITELVVYARYDEEAPLKIMESLKTSIKKHDTLEYFPKHIMKNMYCVLSSDDVKESLIMR